MQKKLITQMYRQERYYWWHRAKRTLVHRMISRFFPSKKLQSMDIGCGTGLLLEELARYGSSWGVDISAQSLSFCKKRGLKNLKQGELGNKQLPFKSNTFDVITALDVIEHIDDDVGALREIRRMLNKNGILIVTVPAYQFLFSYWDRMLGHKRRYTKHMLIDHAKTAGFTLQTASYFHSYLIPITIVVRIIKTITRSKSSDFVELPKPINALFFSLSQIEQSLLSTMSIPFGLSVVGVFRK